MQKDLALFSGRAHGKSSWSFARTPDADPAFAASFGHRALSFDGVLLLGAGGRGVSSCPKLPWSTTSEAKRAVHPPRQPRHPILLIGVEQNVVALHVPDPEVDSARLGHCILVRSAP